MKYLLILGLLFTTRVFAQEVCDVKEDVVTQVVQEDVNTPTPKELEGSEIVIKMKDGTIRTMKSEEFKVVKRKQQFKTKEKVIVQRVECQPRVVEKEVYKKNMLIGGVANDYTGLDTEVNGNSARIKSRKNAILDIGYMRKRIFDTSVGLGLSINTNGSPRIFAGYEF